MVIIRINAQVKGADWQELAMAIHEQAIYGNGLLILPHFCELLNEVPADEEIKVIVSKDDLQTLQRESDCNNCGKVGTCYHNHGRHGVVRINCPLWRPKA